MNANQIKLISFTDQLLAAFREALAQRGYSNLKVELEEKEEGMAFSVQGRGSLTKEVLDEAMAEAATKVGAVRRDDN